MSELKAHASSTTLPRPLIVGSSGQVGSQLAHSFEAQGQDVLRTSRRGEAGALPVDLSVLPDAPAVAKLLDNIDLAAIYCVAGMTYVDGCESQPDLAYRINAHGPAALAAYAQGRKVPFVFYSTEYVFDGSAQDPGPYTEESPVHALSVYGKSKLAGELAVIEANPDALVLRTTVVYGPDAQRKNFVYSLMKNLGAGERMRVPEDQVSTPTYNRDLVRATLALVEAGASGIFHVTGPELLGRLDFAKQAADLLGLDGSLLDGVSTASLGQTAPRPLQAGLSTAKLRTNFPHVKMQTLAESLHDCMAELRSPQA